MKNAKTSGYFSERMSYNYEKIIKYFLIFTILILCTYDICIETRAEGTGDAPYEEIYVPSDEERALEQRKMQELYSTPTALTEGFKTLPVTCYEQENGYYCGPATVKQVVYYLTRVEKEQSYFAQALGTTVDGTDFSNIPGVLNSEIGETHYVYSGIQNKELWYGRIRISTNNNYPVVLDIKTKDVEGFPYGVTGHIVNVSGYDEISSPTQVRITDPYKPGLGNKWYSEDVLYNANNAHSRKAMIW